MPTTPAINATVTITAKDINGNSVAKTYNNVIDLEFDFFKGMVRITTMGQHYFSLLGVTALTYTVVTGATTVVMS